ncbi:MAG TPA: hypothetical protein VK550_19605 [Polyangiaceae bacterium]|nr:hypothetical protein [Polyangiaceae bacterium]
MDPEKIAPARALSAEVEARLTQALLVVCAAGIAYLFLQISMFRYGRDQGIYATVAESMLRGGMPYRDAWDFKPPGVFAVYAFVRAVFGPAETSIRIFEVLGLASVAGAFVIWSARFFSDWRIGVVGAALGVLVHAELEFWHTAQPESFGGMLTAWALVLGTFEPKTEDPRRRRKLLATWALCGACYGAAFLMKPPLGGGALVSSAFVTVRMVQTSRRNHAGQQSWSAYAWPTLTMGAGSLVPIALCVAWYAARGAFGDLYDAIFVFAPHYTKLSWEGASVMGALYLAFEEWFVDLSAPTAAGVLAAILLPPASTREREGTFHLLAVIVMQLVGVAWQGKFFPYHYGASLLLGSLVAGLGAYKLWQRALSHGKWAVALFALTSYLVVQARSATRDTRTDFLDRCIARHRQVLGLSDMTREELDANLYSVADVSYGANRRVAEFLRRELAPTDFAFIWGFEPIIYDMSERRPASRYIYNVPQRVAWAKDQTRATLMTDLDARPPKAIVVEHRDVFPVVTGDALDSADTLKRFPALAARIDNQYALTTTIEDFDVYMLR